MSRLLGFSEVGSPEVEGRASCCLVCGNHTGCHDDLIGIGGGCIVEEGLGRVVQLGIILGCQHEGTLDGVGAVLDGGFAGSHTANLDSLHGVLNGGQRGVADGAGVLSHSGDHVAGGAQFLTVLLGVSILAEGILNLYTVISTVLIIKHQQPDVIEIEYSETK